MKNKIVPLYALISLFSLICFPACRADEPQKADAAQAVQTAVDEASASNEEAPMITDESKKPVVAELSPWEKRATERPKRLWADTFLWAEAPKIEVESWYNDAPEANYKSKYILLEVWATWCPPCRRSLPMLNHWQEKFGDELCVITICETDAKAIDEMVGDLKGKDLKFHVGIDLQKRTYKALGVFGIPHAVIIEPQYGCVIWEGMPNQPGHELTDEIIEKILAVGRKANRAQGGGTLR